jgi:hypothetical protein
MDWIIFRYSESTAERGRPGGPYHQGGHLGGQPGPHVLGLGPLSLTCWAFFGSDIVIHTPTVYLNVIYAVRLAE